MPECSTKSVLRDGVHCVALLQYTLVLSKASFRKTSCLQSLLLQHPSGRPLREHFQVYHSGTGAHLPPTWHMRLQVCASSPSREYSHFVTNARVPGKIRRAWLIKLLGRYCAYRTQSPHVARRECGKNDTAHSKRKRKKKHCTYAHNLPSPPTLTCTHAHHSHSPLTLTHTYMARPRSRALQ